MAAPQNWTPARIRELRERLKLTQEAVAAQVGVTKAQWCHWEKGRYTPSGSVVLLLELLDEGLDDSEVG